MTYAYYLFGFKPCSTRLFLHQNNGLFFVYFFLVLSHQAIDARDALAKSIYASLFDWLVEQINKSLAVGKRRTGRSISILDIYGFESFNVCFFLVSLFFFSCMNLEKLSVD